MTNNIAGIVIGTLLGFLIVAAIGRLIRACLKG